MGKWICLLFLFFPFGLRAWTLNTAGTVRFPSDTVTLNVRSGVACTNAGVTHAQLLDDAFEAVNKYWNQVPSSRLRFVKGSVKSGDPYDLVTVPGMDENEIVIGCEIAGAVNAQGAIAVGGIGSVRVAGNLITSSYVTIDSSANTTYDTTSKLEKLSIMAHEIGHAFGLGHSEDDSLMFYQVQSAREKLGYDDVAAVTYLYPRREEALGFGGSCASIALIDSNKGGPGGPGPLLLSLFLGLILGVLSLRPIKGFFCAP